MNRINRPCHHGKQADECADCSVLRELSMMHDTLDRVSCLNRCAGVTSRYYGSTDEEE